MSAPGSRRLRRAALLVALAPALGGCVTQFNLRTDTLATPPTQPTVGPGSWRSCKRTWGALCTT